MKEQKLQEVYLHRNPVTKEVFYVGSGKWHKYPSLRRATRFDKGCNRPNAWFEIVEQYGLPIVEYLYQNLTKKEARKIEELITIEYKSLGYPLVNNNNGDKHSEQTRAKMSDIVNQYSKDGTFLKQYPSLNEAYRQTGVDNGSIRHCCRGTNRVKSAGGFIWKYENNQTTN